jgi:hypothetical protein
VEGAACISQEGEGACPAGWPVETQAYQSWTDNRACAACACDMGTVGCIGGGWEAYDLNFCSVLGDKLAIGTNCTSVSGLIGQQASLKAIAAAPTPPTVCSSEGTGSVDAQGPMKLCCRTPP